MFACAGSPLRRIAANRPGVALPAAIFSMVLVSLMSAGIFVLTDLDNTATKNRHDTSMAEQVAHPAGAHAMSLLRDELTSAGYSRMLRGFDNLGGTADDGLLVGFKGLGDSLDIPAAGRAIEGGRYYVQLMDDPADTDNKPLSDMNRQIVVRCTGVTTGGSRAVIDLLVGSGGTPALVFEKQLTINGNPTTSGECGDIHVNGPIHMVGTARVTSYVSTTADKTGNGRVRDADNESIEPLTYQPPIEIPTMKFSDYCPQNADYILTGAGLVIEVSTGATYNANSSSQFGWRRRSNIPVIWTSETDDMTSGTFCISGNVEIGHTPGKGVDPLPMTVIASGSIKISGNPHMMPEDSSNVTLLAGGDLTIHGNPGSFNAVNYVGLLYAGRNCEIGGNPNLSAQIFCKSGNLPGGATSLAPENRISGNPKLIYDCKNGGDDNKRRIRAWYPRVGM